VARKLVTLPEIPLLSNGKTDYVSLQSLAEDDTYGRLISAAVGRSVSLSGGAEGSGGRQYDLPQQTRSTQ
jgi:hypothetical protein